MPLYAAKAAVLFSAETEDAKKKIQDLNNNIKSQMASAEKSASKSFQDLATNASKSLSTLSSNLTKAGKTMTLAITAPLIALGTAAAKMAMDAIESENLVAVTFGKMTGEITKWSNNLSNSLGLNAYEVRKQAGVMYVMTKSMGLAEEQAFDLSKNISMLAYDMASFYNLDPTEAFDKLRAGLSGESEPLKRLGIIVNETTIKTYAYTHGLAEQGKELTEQQKVLARYGVIMEATKEAQGDLARTIESPTNQLRVLKSSITMTVTELGMSLMPMMQSAMKVIKEWADKVKELVAEFRKLPQATQDSYIKLALLVAAGGPILIGLGMVANALKVIVGLVVGLAANPVIAGLLAVASAIGLIVTAVNALNSGKAGLMTNLATKWGVNFGPETTPGWQNINSALPQAPSVWDQLKGSITQVGKSAAGAVPPVDDLAGALSGAGEAAGDFNSQLTKIDRFSAWGRLNTYLSEANQRMATMDKLIQAIAEDTPLFKPWTTQEQNLYQLKQMSDEYAFMAEQARRQAEWEKKASDAREEQLRKLKEMTGLMSAQGPSGGIYGSLSDLLSSIIEKYQTFIDKIKEGYPQVWPQFNIAQSRLLEMLSGGQLEQMLNQLISGLAPYGSDTQAMAEAAQNVMQGWLDMVNKPLYESLKLNIPWESFRLLPQGLQDFILQIAQLRETQKQAIDTANQQAASVGVFSSSVSQFAWCTATLAAYLANYPQTGGGGIPARAMQAGGLITKPTIVLAGEREPEWFLPASKLETFFAMLASYLRKSSTMKIELETSPNSLLELAAKGVRLVS